MKIALFFALYFELMNLNPNLFFLGNAGKGEIEVISEKMRIEEIQELQSRRPR
jgi:hypothetical protein